jgi:hypothetical protein
MGIFDTIVKGVGDYLDSEDGDEMIDNFRGFFSDESGDAGEGGGGGGSGFGGFVSSLFGDAEEGEGGGGGTGGGFGGFVSSFLGDSEEGEGGESGGGGWGGTFGRIVDQLSGDGGRDDLWDRAVSTVADRVSQYLPEELREVAGQYLGHSGQGPGGQGQGGQGQGSSWAGSLVDANQTQVPSGWHGVANHPTIGHSYGEAGFGGFLDHSIANLSGHPGMQPGYVMSPQSPQSPQAPQPGNGGQPYGSPDPRVSMPAEALQGARFVDSDGDGYIDQIYPQGSLPRRMDGDDYGTEPDGYIPDARSDTRGYDTDGDGYPDSVDPIGGADIEHGGSLGRSTPEPGYDERADYDDMVTSGVAPAEPRYEAPDDPTFPDDPGPAAVSGPAPMPVEPPAVEAPAGDFEQSIDDANQVDASMDTMFDGLEGQA